MSEIKDYWNRIEMWFQTNNPEDLDKLGEGATEEEISEFEKYINTRLPEEFRESLKIHDGMKVNTILLHDGFDNFYLYPLETIKEKFDYRNKNWKEEIEAYIETGEKFSPKEIPIYGYATGDKTCMNPETGKLLMVSHDGFSTNLPDFSSLMKRNADNLESGRFYIGEHGCIATLDVDDAWEKVNKISKILDQLEKPIKRFSKEMKKLGESIDNFSLYECNEHFKRTYKKNHNGQKSKEPIFYDGEELLEFLSFARIAEEHEELPQKFGEVLPIFKNNENGNTIYIEILTDPYNSCVLHKYYANKKERKPLNYDLIDILLLTYNNYK